MGNWLPAVASPQLLPVPLFLAQGAMVVVGLLVAFFGERVHETLVTVGAFLSGAVAGPLVVPAAAIVGLDGPATLLATVVWAIVCGLLAIYLAWMAIYVTVYLAGFLAGAVLGSLIFGLANPVVVLVATIGLGLVLAGVRMGLPVVSKFVAEIGQATGLSPVREFALRNPATRFAIAHPILEDERSLDRDAIRSQSRSKAAYETLVVGLVAVPALVVLAAVVAIVVVGFVQWGNGHALGVAAVGVAGAWTAVGLYRPFLAVSSAFSGAMLVAGVTSASELLRAVLALDPDRLIAAAANAPMTYLLVFAVVFVLGSVTQLWHISHSESPLG